MFSRIGVVSARRFFSSSTHARINLGGGGGPQKILSSKIPITSSLVNNGISFPKLAHTKANDAELVNFLKEEISSEKKSAKGASLASNLEGFEVKTQESELSFVKSFGQELITINLNVNHTIDSEYDGEDPAQQQQQTQEKDDAGQMQSRPNFEVSIKKGDQNLVFNCVFLRPNQEPVSSEEYEDVFAIEEISLFNGDWNEQVYAVSGDILDGYLYDLFMNMLEERGLNTEFMDKLSDYCTQYEHQLYIGFLGRLQNFFTT